ncbi:DUF222 domain-containing protein, partial [Pseudofrankia sp. BMG5.37]|uniref:DUF222 domain-containing protein n=1 Tax=Pseudofrankia sp. BMG5.37 TaxID=3050035 RepID=UPI002894A571
MARLAAVGGVFDELLAGLAACGEAEAFDLVVGLVRLASRLEGLAIRAQVRWAELRPDTGRCLDGDGEGEPFSPYLGDELAAELGQSPRTMTSRLDQAWDLAHRLPAALDALTAGELDQTRLRALHALTGVLSDGQRATVEAQMLAGSQLSSPTQWRRKIHRMISRLDPAAAARRRDEAKAKRDVSIEPAEDGMALLSATLPAEDARAIFDLIDRIARTDAHSDGDSRPIGARRADVLTALLLGNRRERV